MEEFKIPLGSKLVVPYIYFIDGNQLAALVIPPRVTIDPIADMNGGFKVGPFSNAAQLEITLALNSSLGQRAVVTVCWTNTKLPPLKANLVVGPLPPAPSVSPPQAVTDKVFPSPLRMASWAPAMIVPVP